MEESKEEARPSVKGLLDLDTYTVADLHERLGFKKQTIQSWIKAGDLRSVNFGGSAGNLIRREWLVDFLERRAVGGVQGAIDSIPP